MKHDPAPSRADVAQGWWSHPVDADELLPPLGQGAETDAAVLCLISCSGARVLNHKLCDVCIMK